jgi:hypothetical protein
MLNRFTDGNEIGAEIFDNRCIISDPKSLLKSHDLDKVAYIIGAYFDDDIEDLTANESGQNDVEKSDEAASDSGQSQSDTIDPWLEALQNSDPNFPDTHTRGQFDCYVKQITGHFLAFDKAEKVPI